MESQETHTIRQRLKHEGHQVILLGKSLKELGFDLRKIARQMKQTQADAWIVGADLVNEMMAAAKTQNNATGTFIHALVQSEPFRRK